MSGRFRRSGERMLRTANSAPKQQIAIYDWFKNDGWALIGIVLMLCIGVWYFGFRSQRFVMSDIQVSPTRFIGEQDIRSAVDAFTNSKTLGFIQRNTFWTLRADALQKSITDSFQNTVAFEQVRVEKTFPNKISIEINERIPSVTWVTTKSGHDFVYTVDRDGVVTQYLENRDQVDPSFPVIVDANREELGVGWHIVSADYINSMLYVQEHFEEETGFTPASYEFPTIQCSEQQYVAQKIFEQELSDENAPEALKEQQRQIQERFQAGEITVDESLKELERVKKEFATQPEDGEGEITADDEQEGSDFLGDEKSDATTNKSSGDSDNGEDVDRIEWEKVHVPTECDFVTVAHELHVITNDDQAGFAVYMDTHEDADVQMHNVRTVITDSVDDVQALQYIDVRIPDRVYIQ